MKYIIVVCLLVATGLPSMSGTIPTVTTQVNRSDSYTYYIYTLFNDLDSQESINGFTLFMPEVGARSVIDFTSSREYWYAGYSFRPVYSMWFQTSIIGQGLTYGDSITFTLITPANVPMLEGYIPLGHNSNWSWDGGFGIGSLPVPVPEPSSLLMLTGGVFGFIFKRRKLAVMV